jgi:hypothetical protein
MRHLPSLVAAAAVALAAPSARGAEVTRVVSSFEEEDPLGLVLGVGFERTQTRAALLREGSRDAEGGRLGNNSGYQDELIYVAQEGRMNFDLRVGLSRDVEFRVGIPLVFARDENWYLKGGVPAGGRAVLNNTVCPSGAPLTAACQPDRTAGGDIIPDTAPGSLFPGEPSSWSTHRGGLGDARFGLSWAVFNQARDWTKPTWVVALDYQAPTAQRLDPTQPARVDARAPFGERTHRYTVSTAFSRRFGAVDPYFRARYTLPVRGPGWYSNCAPADPGGLREAARLGSPGTCGRDPWDRRATGLQPAHEAGVQFGTELLLGENAEKQQRFTLDVSGHADYVGAGRYYNPLSGLLQRYLVTGDRVQAGGTLGFNAHPADFFRLTGALRLSASSDYDITGEQLEGRAADGTAVRNPQYDDRVDAPGRRFRAADQYVFDLRLGAEFNF